MLEKVVVVVLRQYDGHVLSQRCPECDAGEQVGENLWHHFRPRLADEETNLR